MATIQSVMAMSSVQKKLEQLDGYSLIDKLKFMKKHFDIYIPVGLNDKLVKVKTLAVKKDKLFLKSSENEQVIRVNDIKHHIDSFMFSQKSAVC